MAQAPPAPGRDDRIAIVGGGPGGLHAAWLLKERGFGQVTVYESADRVGGKSLTVHSDGVPHELGSCYLHPAYAEVKRLLDVTGASREVKPGGPNGERDIYSAEITGQLERPVTLGEWMLGAMEQASFPKFLWWAPDKLQAGNMVLAVQRYKLLHRRLFGRYEGDLPPQPDERGMASIDCTFGQFLREHHLEALLPLVVLSSSAMGYGLPETIPALYGLWWNTPAVLDAFLDSGKNPEKPVLTMLEDGFSSLWEAVALNIDVRTGVTVEGIVRSQTGVKLVGHDGGEHWTTDADWLVLTTNLSRSLSFLDADDAESALFEGMHTVSLITHLVEVDHRETAPITYWPDRLKVGLDGRLYCVRDGRKCLRPGEVPPNGRDVLVTYQYADHWVRRSKAGALRRLLREDLEAAGYTGIGIREQHIWPYFTRFTQDAINRGHPWKLFEMQGRNRTWYLGGSACFESVHDITTYNRQVIDRALGSSTPQQAR